MSEIKPCPKITQAEIDAGVAVMWRYAIDDIVRVQTPDHVLARLHTEYCDVFRSAYTAAMAVRTFRDRASEACASVQRERDEAREMLGEAIGYLHDIYGEDLCGDRTNAPSVKPRLYTTYIDWTTRYHVRAFLSRYEGEVK